jgi:hypothetical protein
LEPVKRGDPGALLRLYEGREPDPEFARIVDDLVKAGRRGIRLR